MLDDISTIRKRPESSWLSIARTSFAPQTRSASIC